MYVHIHYITTPLVTQHKRCSSSNSPHRIPHPPHPFPLLNYSYSSQLLLLVLALPPLSSSLLPHASLLKIARVPVIYDTKALVLKDRVPLHNEHSVAGLGSPGRKPPFQNRHCTIVPMIDDLVGLVDELPMEVGRQEWHIDNLRWPGYSENPRVGAEAILGANFVPVP